MPLISIIIPAHNEEKYIEKTLESVQRQTFSDYEVVVVANGCTDRTKEIVRKFKDERINLVSLSIANVSRARNYGASKSSGEIFVFLDADTELEEDLVLEKIKEEFTEDYSIATTKVVPDSPEWKYKLAMQFKNIYNYWGIYHGCSGVLICRRSQFDIVNGYDPEIIVKEHRFLTDKLKCLGKYTCLNTTVKTSMRRLEKWGLWGSTKFWIKQWFKFGVLEDVSYERVR